MRTFLTVAGFLFLFAASSSAQAAGSGDPSYQKVSLHAGYPWTEGLVLNIRPDEAQCRARYGGQWKIKCAQTLGQYGKTVKGIRLSPPADGHWEWTGSSTMSFIPENEQSLRPNTTYAVDIDKLSRPSFVLLDTTRLSVRTPRLGARLVESNFWVDPAPEAGHRLAASFEFNYPVTAPGPEIELPAPEDALFGKPECVWNASRDRLNLSFPVKKLPAQPAQVTILLKGLAQIELVNGKPRYRPLDAKRKGAVFSRNIPGRNDLFTIKKASLDRVVGETLDQEYVLTLETSLYARPEDVFKNLELWELPKFNSPEATVPYNWASAPKVPASVLRKRLQPEPLSADNSPAAGFRFRVPISGNTYLLVKMRDDLLSASKQKLARPWAEVVLAVPHDANLGFLQPGNVLPLSNRGTLDIYATDLDAVVWQVQMVRDPFLALAAQGSDDAFSRPLAHTGVPMDAVSASFGGELPLARTGEGKAQFTTLDLGPLLEKTTAEQAGEKPHGLMRVNLTGYKDGKEKARASRMVLATDLGLLVKRNALGGFDCFVHSLITGKPVADAEVGILGANGKPVVSAMSDVRGHVSFPSLSGLMRESRPVVAVAEHGGRLAWLPLENRSRELNYSEFAAGGTHSTPDGLNAFVFSQRGMYRPGDTLYFGCVTRRADFLPLPDDLPLHAELIDPAGRKIWEQSFTGGGYGLAELEWPSPQTALSGRYFLNVRAGKDGRNIGSVSVRLEAFQPDTLKLRVDVPTVDGWLPTGGLKGETPCEIGFFLQNLYGTPAEGHTIRVHAATSPALFRFDKFEDFIFTDAAPFIGAGVTRDLSRIVTDKNGVAKTVLPEDLLVASSARVTVSAEGFEAGGGRATAAQASFLASPMQKILGYRPLGALTNMQFIVQGQQAELEFIALDPQLHTVAWDNLHFSVARRRYVTSLVSDGNGGFRYDETPVDMPVADWKANLEANGLKLALDTSRAGEFLLVIRDDRGKTLAQIPYAVAGERLAPPDARLAGSKMRARLDKSRYTAGEKINAALSLPYAGSGLISIERDGVVAFSWFEAAAGDSVQSIAVPEDFEGKGYVVVSFVRSPESPAVYMSPLAFHVVPFSANIERRDMELRLSAPAKALPGATVPVTISAKERGQAVLFAVDEGVLQLTDFRTPQPLDALLADRALDVRTLQALDLLMPDRAAPRLSAFGGGMDGGPFGMRFQNPFKRRNEPPAAYWSGLLEVGPEAVAVSIPLPDHYSGKLRIMAVGASQNGVGSCSLAADVAAPLILTPQLPPAVSPGDSFTGRLVIANTTDQTSRVELGMSVDASLQIVQPLPQQAEVAAGSELVLPFTMQVLDEPGAATVTFRAHTGQKEYRRAGFLSVRPASPLRTSLTAGMASSSTQLPVARHVYAQDARSVASLAAVPLPLAHSFARYLDTYPYGCTEQLISRSFAQVLLRAWPHLVGDNESRDKLLSATLGAVRSRFDGRGVSLWPDDRPNLLLTVYAADLLLTMREAGLGGDDALLTRLCDAIQENCALNESSLSAARTSAYAVWVLTREGRITTQLIENLLDAMKERKTAGWQKDVTAALIAAGRREMHMSQEASSVSKLEYTPDGWFDEYAQYALHMTILARYFPDHCDQSAKNVFFEATALAMLQGNYATFSANQGIRALMSLAGGADPAGVQARLYCAEPEAKGETTLLADNSLLQYETARCRTYKLDMPAGSPPLFWQIATTGYDVQPAESAAAQGIEVGRRYLNASGEPIKEVRQGDEVTVEITARSMEDAVKDCVIVDLLPGGFEMLLSRGDGQEEMPEKGITFLDRQEDRLLVFADLTNRPLVFRYRIRPTISGTFAVPPVTAEAMYNQACYGHGAGGRIDVLP